MSRLPETGPSLRRIIEQQKRRATRNENASPYTRSGTSVTAENEVTVDGAFIVNGPLTVAQTADITGTTHIGGATDIDGTLNVDAATTIDGDTTIGGTLGVTGVTTLGAPTTVSGTLGVTGVTTLGAATSVTGALNVSGPMAVTGTLSLPAGIINNAALTSPIEVASDLISTSGFAYTVTPTDRASITIPVPAGFTSASVFAGGTARAYNVTGSTQYLFLKTFCEVVGSGVSTAGGVQQAPIWTGYQSTTAGTHATTVTMPATPAQSIRVWTEVWASADIAAYSGNYTAVEAIVLFTR